MNWVDLALIVLMVVAVVSGLREGLSRSGFGFLSLVIAFLSAALLYPAKPAGFVIVFVLVIAVAGVAAKVLGRSCRNSGLSWLDRVLGGVFGLANGLIFAVLIVLGMLAFGPKIPRHYVAHSAIAPYALNAACAVAEVVPEEMKGRVQDSYQELVTLLPPPLRRAAARLPQHF